MFGLLFLNKYLYSLGTNQPQNAKSGYYRR